MPSFVNSDFYTTELTWRGVYILDSQTLQLKDQAWSQSERSASI